MHWGQYKMDKDALCDRQPHQVGMGDPWNQGCNSDDGVLAQIQGNHKKQFSGIRTPKQKAKTE